MYSLLMHNLFNPGTPATELLVGTLVYASKYDSQSLLVQVPDYAEQEYLPSALALLTLWPSLI